MDVKLGEANMSLDKELMDVAQAYLSMHEKTKTEDASNDKSDDGDGIDKVDPKAAKKKFKDRKDKDIDNDGDTDDSDEYLHKRRKAIASKDESKQGFIMAAKKAKDAGDKEFVFAGKKYNCEEVLSKNEAAEIEEISVGMQQRYKKKAMSQYKSSAKKKSVGGDFGGSKTQAAADRHKKTYDKRHKGIGSVIKRASDADQKRKGGSKVSQNPSKNSMTGKKAPYRNRTESFYWDEIAEMNNAQIDAFIDTLNESQLDAFVAEMNSIAKHKNEAVEIEVDDKSDASPEMKKKEDPKKKKKDPKVSKAKDDDKGDADAATEQKEGVDTSPAGDSPAAKRASTRDKGLLDMLRSKTAEKRRDEDKQDGTNAAKESPKRPGDSKVGEKAMKKFKEMR